MQHGDPSRSTLGRSVGRAAVLVSSTALAAFLVLRAGGMTGCDGPASPPPQQPAVEAEKKVTAPAPANDQAATAPAPASDQAVAAPNPAPTNTNNAAAGPGPNYFPASKSGVFVERDPSPPPPAREPAVQQQAPQPQQAAPR
jgi:hypothetical protein